MNILYELDSNFAPQVSASIASVCENNQSLPDLNFYIFGLGLSDEVSSSLTELCERYNRQVSIIPIDGFMETFGDFDTLGWTEVVMGRLLVARFLPDDVDRILYLDGDTIVLGSLEELESLVVDDDKVIGAVIEATVDRSRLGALGIEGEPYFNSGVLFIDLEKWKSIGAEQLLIDYCRRHKNDIVAPDQDAINGALKGMIQPLLPCYNWCNSYVFYPYRVLKKLMGDIAYYEQDAFKTAVEHPVIVHYLGEERPWRAGNTHKYCDEYQRYLSKTVYADTPEELGWETYFRAWSFFNATMRVAPMLRYRIITALIPKMMAWRKKARTKKAEES